MTGPRPGETEAEFLKRDPAAYIRHYAGDGARVRLVPGTELAVVTTPGAEPPSELWAAYQRWVLDLTVSALSGLPPRKAGR